MSYFILASLFDADGTIVLEDHAMGTWLEDLIATRNDPALPTTPTRVIGTSFQPSLTGWTQCSYVVEQVAATTQDGTVTLSIGPVDPPATAATSCRVVNANANSHTERRQLTVLVPPAYFVKLVATGNTTNTLVQQIETITS